MKAHFIEEILPAKNLLDEILSQEEMNALHGGNNGPHFTCHSGIICWTGRMELKDANKLKAW